MIWKSHECIFIHIPKTSGSSIELMFKENGATYHYKSKHKFASYHAERHSRLWKLYFKFSVVRNPWDRIYSLWYNYFMDGQTKMDFPSYVKKLPMTGKIFDQSQVNWLFVYGRNPMDYVGRFEEKEKVFDFLINRFDLKVDQIPHSKETEGKPPYTDYYDGETIDIVSRVFEDDIREFGYTFDGFR